VLKVSLGCVNGAAFRNHDGNTRPTLQLLQRSHTAPSDHLHQTSAKARRPRRRQSAHSQPSASCKARHTLPPPTKACEEQLPQSLHPTTHVLRVGSCPEPMRGS
jgi:hypothetical protein